MKHPDAPYVGLEHLVTDQPRIAGWAPAQTSVSVNTVFRAGDTLFGKLRPNLRKVASADFDGYCSTDILVLRPTKGNSGAFLSHLLRSHEVLDFAAGTAFGTKMPRTAWSMLKDLAIRIPTLPEQHRIAEILQALDDQIHTTERIVSKLILTKHGLVSDILPLNGQVEMRPLREVADVSGGVTLGSEPSGPGTIRRPYLRVANVQDGHLDLREVKFLRIRAADLDRFSLSHGDVLMNEGGDADKLGRGTVWESQIEGCLHQNHVFRVRTDRRLLEPWFLAHVSGSAYGKKYFLGASKQTTNLATINSTQIGAFPIPLPAVDEQQRIVKIISSHDSLISHEQSSLAKLRSIKAGLMSDILTGRVRVSRDAAS
jgi:type I restriction enzyme S subunit